MTERAWRYIPGMVQKRLPILGWLPHYSLKWLQLDSFAGFTVGLTVVPQALAYAEVAGLPVQYGLYSSFMGCFVYFFLGTSRDVTLGPTAIMSLLVSFYALHQPAYAVLLTFLSGCIQLAMGILHLGFLLDFISYPVIKGFTSAASITIGFGQIKNLLGLHDIPQEFFLQVYYTFLRVGQTRLGDTVLGLVCMVLLLLLKAMRDQVPPLHQQMPPCIQLSHIIVWSIATGLTNLLGSFVSSYPVTGSFGRTAVNAQTGVCTPAGGLVTGLLVMLSLAYLTPLFYYIPKAALAAVIITAVAPLFDVKILWTVWRVKRLDLVPMCVTFLFCFWEVQYGILAGTLVSGMLLLYHVARPQIQQISEGPVLVLRPISGLHFPAVEALQKTVYNQALSASPPRSTILDCTHICNVDYTVMTGLRELLAEFQNHGASLVFAKLQAPVLFELLSAELKGFQHFSTLEEAEKYLSEE
ncbi:sodium-independent sulfate anion transporter [Gracilinanus agilis]|uniref:sodium-independent sulfate anion transporter n=1 Tax=Gracilinanus agilis TaxID=191870 RepID=UPI001CFCEC94|nr:sodium-independent sulfate anion transporter [Gracilinanus agilis]